MEIEFIEDTNEGYAPRTRINASADITIAFALDFTSAGEKLTKRCVKEQGKVYIPVDKIQYSGWSAIGDDAFEKFHKYRHEFPTNNKITLNIAGNGIYTLKGGYNLNQHSIDEYVYKFLKQFISFAEHHDFVIKSIRSGGQTGFDEAGLKAAVKLNIPAICLAPKGWKFRNQFGQDILNETQFKQRFICH
jgi:hypothetical protein